MSDSIVTPEKDVTPTADPKAADEKATAKPAAKKEPAAKAAAKAADAKVTDAAPETQAAQPAPAKPAPTTETAAAAKPAAATEAKAAPAGGATPAAEPAAPVEKPFCPDVLISCTARFTRKAWDIFLKLQKEDINLLTTVPLRAVLTARSSEGASEIHQVLMKEKGVTEIKLSGKTITTVATFADIQQVIKHPQTHMLDASLANKA
jgi:hypothetical protein